MKYCPYCGADLLGGTASFCSECGKPIRKRKQDAKSGKKYQTHKRKKNKYVAAEEIVLDKEAPPDETAETVDDGYDGYYDDVRPADENIERPGLDKAIVKNLIVIIAGVIVAISICVMAMYFM